MPNKQSRVENLTVDLLGFFKALIPSNEEMVLFWICGVFDNISI